MAQLLLANPRKRRRRSPARRRSTALSRTRRRYRRNPSPRGMMKSFQKGAVGGVGALAVDVVMQKLPIPANLQIGVTGAAVKGLVGIGLGMLVSQFMRNKPLGEQLADGAVTVSLYNVGKEMLGPTIGLSGPLLGDLLYESDSDMGLGYQNVAPTYDSPDGFDEDF